MAGELAAVAFGVLGLLLLVFMLRPSKAAAVPVAPARLPMDLPFKDTTGFFEYQCKFGDTQIREGSPVVAIVRDARNEFRTNAAVKLEDNGTQLAVISVASDDGGFSTIARTQNEGKLLTPGDLVLWQPGKRMPKPITEDPRTRWVGLIIASIEPVLSADGMHRVVADYRRRVHD